MSSIKPSKDLDPQVSSLDSQDLQDLEELYPIDMARPNHPSWRVVDQQLEEGMGKLHINIPLYLIIKEPVIFQYRLYIIFIDNTIRLFLSTCIPR